MTPPLNSDVVEVRDLSKKYLTENILCIVNTPYFEGNFNTFKVSPVVIKYYEEKNFITPFYDYIESIRDFRKLTSEQNFEMPNSEVIEKSIELVEYFKGINILPDKITPSLDGGIMFELLHSKTYFLIELFNDGDIVFLRRYNDSRKSLDVDFNELKKLISDSFNA